MDNERKIGPGPDGGLPGPGRTTIRELILSDLSPDALLDQSVLRLEQKDITLTQASRAIGDLIEHWGGLPIEDGAQVRLQNVVAKKKKSGMSNPEGPQDRGDNYGW